MGDVIWLWTDILLWTLVGLAGCTAIHIWRAPISRQAWRQVFYRPFYLAASLILLLYLFIGLADSIHFKQHNGQIESALDIALPHLHQDTEETFSAPFACQAYTKSQMNTANGVVRDYAPLNYACNHIRHETQKGDDIVQQAIQALIGPVVGLLGILLLVGLYRPQKLWVICCGKTPFPWRTLLGTLFVLSGLMAILMTLSYDYHVLGTNKIGEDVFYVNLKSIRTGLVIGTVTTFFMLPLAVTFGLAAGYFRGIIDDVIQYVYTTISAVPGVLLIAAAVLSLQVYMHNEIMHFTSMLARADARLLALCMILGLTGWTGLCRLLRGEALKLRSQDYVQAAHVLGVSHLGILRRHLLPNVMHIILIAIALDFSGLVLSEAVLSYVGVGVDPTTYSWGNMINTARLEMARVPVVWWPLAGAFVFMFGLVLCANIFADGVREAFDPRARKIGGGV